MTCREALAREACTECHQRLHRSRPVDNLLKPCLQQRQQDPEFAEAWADALERAADRYEDRRDELSIEGNHPGSTIFQLKNRRPERWQDRHDVTVEKHEKHTYIHELGPNAERAILARRAELAAL